MKSPRLWVVLVLLAATAAILHLRGDKDRVPPSQLLSSLPQSIGQWIGQDIPLDENVLVVLGDGRFLNRIYSNPLMADAEKRRPENLIGLFIGYFPTQRTGQAIHSPQNCLPGAGWPFESSQQATLSDANGKPYKIGQYLITDGTSRQVVLYWYRAHGRNIANDYLAKAYMLADAIRFNRTDGALIRVSTPLQANETVLEAQNRALGFASQMSPLLAPYIPD